MRGESENWLKPSDLRYSQTNKNKSKDGNCKKLENCSKDYNKFIFCWKEKVPNVQIFPKRAL